MLTVLGGLAEFERELIRARTGEGRERAKARGVRLGRKPKLNQHQQQEALARRDAGEPVTEIARSYDVHHATISRLQSWQSRLAMIEPHSKPAATRAASLIQVPPSFPETDASPL